MSALDLLRGRTERRASLSTPHGIGRVLVVLFGPLLITPLLALLALAPQIIGPTSQDEVTPAAPEVGGRLFLGMAGQAYAQPAGLPVDSELVYVQQSEHIVLDPMSARTVDEWNLIDLVVRGLVTVKKNFQLGPDLATYSLHEQGDKIRVSFRLRAVEWAGIDLTRPTEVTAKDVLYTLTKARGRTANATANGPIARLMSSIVHFEVEGEEVVHVDFDRSQWRSDTLGQLVNLRILSRQQARKNRQAGNNRVGKPWSTGPYVVHSKSGGTVRLQLRRDLPDKLRPAISVIQREHQRDMRVVRADLVNGITDLVTDLSPRDAREIGDTANSKARTEVTPSLSYTFVGYNHRHPLLGDVAFRRALAHMVDRKALIGKVFDNARGAAIPITGPYDPHLPGTHDPDLEETWRHEAEKAAAMLDEICGKAPKKGERLCRKLPLNFKLVFNGDLTRSRRVADALQKMFAAHGITIEPKGLTSEAMRERLARPKGAGGPSFDMILHTHALSLNYDPTPAWHSKGLDNAWGYANSRVDGILERQQKEADSAVRLALLRALHEATYEDQTALFLWSRQRFMAVNRRFVGVEPGRLDFFRSLTEWTIDMKQLAGR